MPDFSDLLRAPAGEAKRPQPLPVGDYPGTIKGYELGDNNKNRTRYVRLQIVLTDWPANFSEQDIPEDVDLPKRQLRKDLYVTPDSLWRLDAFLKSCGIVPNGRVYEEVLPEMIGQAVLVAVNTYTNPQGETGNTVDTVLGLSGTDQDQAAE